MSEDKVKTLGDSPRRVVALDRDGTIIVEKNYLSDPAGVELLPGAAAGLRHFREAGWDLVIVSNQSGIGRGYFSEADYEKVTARLGELLRAEGVELAGIYHCPHAPGMPCDCRKPLPGMLVRAAADLHFAIKDCVVIGDKPADVELGRNAGVALTILVRTGYGAETAAQNDCRPDAICDNLSAAAEFVCNQGKA